MKGYESQRIKISEWPTCFELLDKDRGTVVVIFDPEDAKAVIQSLKEFIKIFSEYKDE